MIIKHFWSQLTVLDHGKRTFSAVLLKKKVQTGIKIRFWPAVVACIMKVILNCSRKWDSVLFIYCRGCIRPWGETGRHSCQMLKKSILVHKTWAKQFSERTTFLPGFSSHVGRVKICRSKLLLLFYFELLTCGWI